MTPPDPADPEYVTVQKCFDRHIVLERRISHIEILSGVQVLATVATFVTVLYYIWRFSIGS